MYWYAKPFLKISPPKTFNTIWCHKKLIVAHTWIQNNEELHKFSMMYFPLLLNIICYWWFRQGSENLNCNKPISAFKLFSKNFRKLINKVFTIYPKIYSAISKKYNSLKVHWSTQAQRDGRRLLPAKKNGKLKTSVMPSLSNFFLRKFSKKNSWKWGTLRGLCQIPLKILVITLTSVAKRKNPYNYEARAQRPLPNIKKKFLW